MRKETRASEARSGPGSNAAASGARSGPGPGACSGSGTCETGKEVIVRQAAYGQDQFKAPFRGPFLVRVFGARHVTAVAAKKHK
jgi:hypothetical protein